MYKKIVLSTVSALMLASSAYADTIEGSIQKVDQSEGTLQLSDGNVYKLPGEFDYNSVSEGANVVVTYDVDGENRNVSNVEAK